jgi:hypothetical protein
MTTQQVAPVHRAAFCIGENEIIRFELSWCKPIRLVFCSSITGLDPTHFRSEMNLSAPGENGGIDLWTWCWHNKLTWVFDFYRSSRKTSSHKV